jgi:acetylglutamate kinase
VAVIVIKLGGEVIAGPELPHVASDVAVFAGRGDRVIVVHGGGPQATELSRRLGIETKQVGGRRITDAPTLDVMKMVLAGKLNVDLCAALVAAGVRAVGLHGASALSVEAARRPPRVVSGGGPEPIDFGLVGDVTGFNRPLLELLLGEGYVPVLACLGADAAGNVYNINADIVGNQLAGALAADHLFLVTSTPGVLRDVKDPSSRLPLLTVAEARAAIADGTVTGGMIPKLEEAIQVLGTGVAAIHIVGKLGPGDLLRAVDHPGSAGTTLVCAA